MAWKVKIVAEWEYLIPDKITDHNFTKPEKMFGEVMNHLNNSNLSDYAKVSFEKEWVEDKED